VTVRPHDQAGERPEIAIELVDGTEDDRGFSASITRRFLERIGPVQDVHVTTVAPGAVRGNHFHVERRELLAVGYRGRWSLHWDTGAGTVVHSRRFDGVGQCLVYPPPHWSHAVSNDGDVDLVVVGLSDRPYAADPDGGGADSFPRPVT
jgi:dTDP-4-dehydrorhamnose 3,5-epimerase-like enzyme